MILHLTSRIFTGLHGLCSIPVPAPQLHWTPNTPLFSQHHFALTSPSAQNAFIYFSSKSLCIFQSQFECHLLQEAFPIP